MTNTLSYDAKAVSPTGKVHHVVTGAWKNGNVDPLCNSRSWIGGYWGKPWKVVDKETPVTCKNCLSTMGEAAHKVGARFASSSFGSTAGDNFKCEEFKTKVEADAYIKGLKDAKGWRHVEVDGETI